MSVQMIKHNGKMVPAIMVDGEWVPDLNSELHMTKDGLTVAPIGEKLPVVEEVIVDYEEDKEVNPDDLVPLEEDEEE